MSGSQQSVKPHPRHLPVVRFVEDEEAFLKESEMTPEEAALEMRRYFVCACSHPCFPFMGTFGLDECLIRI